MPPHDCDHWMIPGVGEASRKSAWDTFEEIIAETAALYRQRIYSLTSYYRMPGALRCTSFKLIDESVITVLARVHEDHIDVIRHTEAAEAPQQDTIN